MLNTLGPGPRGVRQPIFNLPSAVSGVAILLLGIHAVRVWLLPPAVDDFILIEFPFDPALPSVCLE